jgi:hypothetical protein
MPDGCPVYVPYRGNTSEHADWQVPRRVEFSDCKGQVLGAAMLLDSAIANNASSR